MAGKTRSLHRVWPLLVSSLLIAFMGIRSALVPFSHDEVATFYFYIQPGDFLPFLSHIDANGHFLMSALSWISFQLFGSSPFVLRLPSLAALALLCYAVYRSRILFTSRACAAGFASSFILVYTFVAYFSMCRGYGISMACLVMGLFYFYSYLNHRRHRHFVKFLLFLHLALAANLTLLFVVMLCTGVTFAVHLHSRQLSRIRVLASYAVNLALLVFWALYAFYLRDHGALYYGAGKSYWEVTFVSLIDSLFGSGRWTTAFFLILLSLSTGLWLYRLFKERVRFIKQPAFVAFVLFSLLVLCFYLLKKLAGVNYPEDRTGLFFYVFFVFAFFYLADRAYGALRTLAIIVPALAAVLYALPFVDLYNHPWSNYETMPARFYERLVQEEKSSGRRITIAGHRVREFFYGFLNYRGSYKLNHITAPEALQMNCDYALGVAADEPWYRDFYTEIDRDDKWGFRLLKRNAAIEKEMIRSGPPAVWEGDGEYFNCLEIVDTTFSSDEPLQAEVTFLVEQAPVPLQAWLVLQCDAVPEEDDIFVRTPLDLVAHDWNRQESITLCLTTGRCPTQIKRLVVYLWNMNKQPLRIRVTGFRLVRLHAPGINEISKAEL